MKERDPKYTVLITCGRCGLEYPVDTDPEPQIEDMREHLAVCKGLMLKKN